ncbi:crosslink repair DNA glycosylase YcaQ family protein [Uliginosibacterium sp. 31-16]|uniref:winged helix-turn-helix domain-containing protein n=1 Tax=Uliginosibacterium sp. 31-16 TaxID=3068315 RepID=UPI00273EFAE2|nr:crosslink repair DNA glycosylase YcaQ family protein [Uliginosibacterium sp. 31-16]MDP5239679.1 crosslink repair DNA glycosylase YcaQ family protein [Uliginosibacterium sp. 31-16]
MLQSADLTVSPAQMRRFLVSYQGLDGDTFAGPQGVLDYVARVGCIQFDPLNVVGHNQELVLQARLRGFSRDWLRDLLYTQRALFDGWDKNMSILLTRDWPCFARLRTAARQRFDRPERPAAAIFEDVRQALRERGPLCSADIEAGEAVTWSWAPTRMSRAALESLYFCGELLVARKKGTRRYYDLATRLLPATLLEAPDPHPAESAYDDWYVMRRIGAVGALWNRPGGAWLGIAGFNTARRKAAFARLEAAGQIRPVKVTGLAHPLYVRSEDVALLDGVAEREVNAAAILAPLDNLLWDRDLIASLFNFEYRWEVYKPAAERTHGYYVLPVLLGDGLVARFEPARYRPGEVLHIANWWWETGFRADDVAQAQLAAAFARFCDYLGASAITVDAALSRRCHLGFLRQG